LEKFGLPVATTLSAKDLWNAALADKKRSGDTVNLIVPKSIGCCQIVPTDVESFKTLLKEGL
jgi:3-dehydroquinate synthase